MLRHPSPARRAAAAALAVALGLALAACGTKGPLVPAPKSDGAAAEPAKKPPRDGRSEPKL